MRLSLAALTLVTLVVTSCALSTALEEDDDEVQLVDEVAEDTIATQEQQELKDGDEKKTEDPDIEMARKRPVPWDKEDNQVYQYRSRPPSDVLPYQGPPEYLQPGPPQFCCPHPVQCHYPPPPPFGPPPPFYPPPPPSPDHHHPGYFSYLEDQDVARGIKDAGSITVDRTTAKRRALNPAAKPTRTK